MARARKPPADPPRLTVVAGGKERTTGGTSTKVTPATRVKRGRASADGRRQGRKAKIEWGKAFAFYFSLAPPERVYAAVADEFGMTEATVRKHAAKETWPERAKELDRVVWDRVLNEHGVPQRAEIVRLSLQVAKAALVRQLALFADPSYSPSLAETVQAVKLAQLVQGEPTERFELEMFGAIVTMDAEEFGRELDSLRAADVVEGTRPTLQLPPVGRPLGRERTAEERDADAELIEDAEVVGEADEDEAFETVEQRTFRGSPRRRFLRDEAEQTQRGRDPRDGLLPPAQERPERPS